LNTFPDSLLQPRASGQDLSQQGLEGSRHAGEQVTAYGPRMRASKSPPLRST
jgi:hypothetical protein